MTDHRQEVGAYAARLAHRGYSASMIERALLRYPPILDVQARRGASKARDEARRRAAWAVRFVKENPADEYRSRIPARIVAYREAADAHRWVGRTGPTDRRVLEAFFLSATFAMSTKFRFAARTIGTRTGMPWSTAAVATRRLLDLRVLRKVGNYGEGLGTKYQLAAPEAWNLHNRQSPPSPIVPGLGLRAPGDRLVEQVLRHPAFGRRALGDAGWMVTYWLRDDEPAKARQLEAATGIAYDRVRVTLGALHRAGIARPVPDGWVRIPDIELGRALDRFVAPVDLLLVQERGTSNADSWWMTWWGSLTEEMTRAA